MGNPNQELFDAFIATRDTKEEGDNCQRILF